MPASKNPAHEKQRSLAWRIAKACIRLGIALLLVVSGTLFALFTFEQQTLRPMAEYMVERTTGRSLSIAGELELSAGSIVTLRATDLTLANAEWGSRQPMLAVTDVTLAVELSNLFRATAPIENLTINGVRLLIEEDAEGLSNWSMAAPGKTAADDISPDNTNKSSTIVLPVARSNLSNIEITVINPALPRPLPIQIESAGHDMPGSDTLQAKARGSIDSQQFSLQADIQTLRQLLAAGAVDIRFKAIFESATLDARAQIDSLTEPQKASATLSMESVDMAPLLQTLGLPEALRGATRIEAKLLPTGDEHELNISVDSSAVEIESRARLHSLTHLDGASLELTAQGPDLALAAQLAGLEVLSKKPFKLNSTVSLAGNQVSIDKTRFDAGDSQLLLAGSFNRLEPLDNSRLELTLTLSDYLEYAQLIGVSDLTGLSSAAFELQASLESGAQDTPTFKAQAKLADIAASINGRLTTDPSLAGSRLEYRVEGQDGKLLQQLLGRPTRVAGSYRLQGKIRREVASINLEQTVFTFGSSELKLTGSVADARLQGDSNLSLQFTAASLDDLAALAGYSGFVPAGKASIEAQAATDGKAIRVQALGATLGRSRLQASGVVSLQSDLQDSRVEISIDGADIIDLLPANLTQYLQPEQAFKLQTELIASAGQVSTDALRVELGAARLQTAGRVSLQRPLTQSSLQIEATVPDLSGIASVDGLAFDLPNAALSLSGGLSLSTAGLQFEAVKATVGDDKLEFSGSMPIDTPTDGLDLVIKASGPNLDEFIPVEIDGLEFTELGYDLAGRLRLSQGFASLQKFLFSTPRGNLTGDLRVSLAEPLTFGEFDIEAKGKNLREFFPGFPQYTPAAVPFDLVANGNWDKTQLSIRQGSLKLADTRIEAQGDIKLPPETTASRLVLSAQGENLADLGEFGDIHLPAKRFDVNATVESNGKKLELPSLDARIGSSDLRGNLLVVFGEIPQINLQLDSNLIDLHGLKGLQPTDDGEDSEQLSQQDGRVIPKLQIPVDLLRQVNLETRIRLAELRSERNSLKNIEFDSTLEDGKLEVSQLRAIATEGQLIARFQATADGDRILTRGQLEGKDIVLGQANPSADGAQLPELDLRLEFDSAGADLRELSANLNGYARFTGGTGRLANSRSLDLFGSFFTEVVSSINPFVTREPYTNINCFAAYAEIQDGLAKIKPGAVMQTDKLNIFAGGQINLANEQINLRFDTSARRGIGISVGDFINPFVGVSGSLANPKLGVDSKNAMFEGSFAVATGGLSIVAKSLFNRWFGASEPCVNLEEKAQEQRDAAKANSIETETESN